jgi:ATP-dependent Zn protease
MKFGRNNIKIEYDEYLLKRIAYHEIGHTLIACLLNNFTKPVLISIVNQGILVGKTEFSHNNVYKNKIDIYNEIAVYLASSIFESHYCKSSSTLATDDFAKIKELICILEKNYMLIPNEYFYSDKKKNIAVNNIINKITDQIMLCIYQNNDIILEFHKQLVEHKTLNEASIKSIIGIQIYDSITLEF